MSIDMVTIDSILLEHTAIQHNVDILYDAVAAQATFLLHSANNWDKTHLKELRDNYLQLRDTMQAFYESIKGHCAREEAAMSPVLGDLLNRGNAIEHKEILGHLDRARALLGKTKLLGDLRPQELMATTQQVAQTIELACDLVSLHEANEAGLFGLLKKALNAD